MIFKKTTKRPAAATTTTSDEGGTHSNDDDKEDECMGITMTETPFSNTIQLPYGTLHIPKQPPQPTTTTTTTSSSAKNDGDVPLTAEELNAVYESLEKLRKLNLEMEWYELGLDEEELCDHEKCVYCLFASAAAAAATATTKNATQNAPSKAAEAEAEAALKSHTGGLLSVGRLFRRGDSNDSTHSTSSATTTTTSTDKKKQKQQQQRLPKKGTPCLICGDPVCLQHSSPSFRKENLTLCLSCEELFQLDFSPSPSQPSVVANNNNNNNNKTNQTQTADGEEEEKKLDDNQVIIDKVEQDDIFLARNRALLERKVQRMVHIYDRCLLLLRYSTQAQLIPDLAAQLETSEVRNNQFRLGTSSAGLLSGTLGFAAATALLAPLAAPLILSSVVLAGGSLVAQGGNAAVNYFDQTNQMADKIITYHGMLLSILQAAHSLRIRILAIQSEQQAVDKQTAMLLDTQQQEEEEQQQSDESEIKEAQNDDGNPKEGTKESTNTSSSINNNSSGGRKKSEKILKTMSVVGTVKTSNEVAHYTATGLKVAGRAYDATATAGAATAATAATAVAEVAESGAVATAANAVTVGGTVADAAATGTTAASAATTTSTAATTAAATTTGAATTAKEGSNLLSSVTTGVTPIIGTVFSVAMMALAARTASSTLKKIRAGNPCDKAVTLRTIQMNLQSLPQSGDFEEECRYLISTIPSLCVS